MLFVLFVCNKKDSIFMCMKISKRKKIACLTFCAFYAFFVYKQHLRGGKSLVCILCFLFFLCFLCVGNLLAKERMERFKSALIPSFTILLTCTPLNLPMENYFITYFYLWSSVRIFPFYENLLNLSLL